MHLTGDFAAAHSFHIALVILLLANLFEIVTTIADLTMEDFVAYIEVIRNILGTEYVFETEIVRIAKAEDIRWINERIRADRPGKLRVGEQWVKAGN